MTLQGFKIKCLILFVAIFFVSKSSLVRAQDLEPRAYSNTPVGLNFLIAGYIYQEGSVLFDPAIQLENAHIQVHGPVLAYARSIDFGGISGKIDVIIPFAWLSGSADFQGQQLTRNVEGFADPRVRITVNFIGAPALPLSGFKNYKQNLVVGASLQINLPFSQYDPERLVNIGTNRFTFKPEIGASKKFGPLFMELAVGASFYTVDHEFYQGNSLSLSPIGYIQGHVIYNFRSGIWAAIDGTYYWGGRPSVNGAEGNAMQKNTRLGLTFALPLNIHNSLKLYLSTGVSTRTGSDFNTIGIAWQYRWGRDLLKRK
ncbi:MAG: transporter [Bacteroidota bacterium]